MEESSGKISSAADPWIIFGCSIGVLAAVAASYHLVAVSPERSRKWISHLIYWAIAVVAIVFLPMTPVAYYVFSSLTMCMVGTLFPIYESVRSVCTPDENDDKEWLQYWIVGGVVFMLTTWVGSTIQSDKGDEYWYTSMSFFFVWLYFPKTQGALLFYENITEPFVAPRVRPLASKMNSMIAYLYQTLTNAVHLWIIWIIFLFLPAGLKRIVAVAIGTVYPFVSSVTAAATEEIEDDTYWLTYWSCYGCLFLIMELLETWLGWVPGFYSLIIFSTVYLMLPMFQGAEKIFRKILVPLAGLQELLMLRDAMRIKKQMLKDLDPERAKQVRKAIAQFYNDDDDEAAVLVLEPESLNNELMTGWSGIRSSFSNPFASKKDGDEPTETTPIV